MIARFFPRVFHYLSQFAWPSVVWTAFILVLCLMPSSELPEGPSLPGLDKIAHIGLFAGWSFLWTCYRPGHFKAIVLGGIVLGLGIEILQQQGPFGRSFEWWDLAADTVGVVLGYAVRTYLIPASWVKGYS